MRYVTFLVLFLFALSASAVTVFQPTNEDVDTILFDPEGTSTGIFALTDPDDADLSGFKIPLSFGPSTLGFAADEGVFINDSEVGWTVSNSEGAELILGSDPSFGIAYFDSVNWLFADVETGIGEDSFLLQWNSGATLAALLVTDVAPVTAVPIPASVWLFGAGLLGMTAVARRRTEKR